MEAAMRWSLCGIIGWISVISLVRVLPGGPATATEPPAEPFLRIEAGMHTAAIKRIAADATGRYLVTGSTDKTVRVWDLESGRLLKVLRPPLGDGNDGRVYSVAMAPDGATVACGGWMRGKSEPSYSIYLFDRATGTVLRRIPGLPGAVFHLAWSPDGRFIAAALSHRGILVFRAHDGTQVGSDTAYGDQSYSVDFHADGRLVSTSWDGIVRLYRVADGGLSLMEKQPAPGGKQPFAARFSPDGRHIAVGYEDSTRVDVLSGDDLALAFSADTTGVNHGNLAMVAWSADGRTLYAGGRYNVGGIFTIRAWNQAGRGNASELPAEQGTVLDIVPLKGGGIAYGTAGPSFGAFDARGQRVVEQRAATGDFGGNPDGFKVSRDGDTVLFSFERWGKSPARVDLGERRIVLGPPSDPALAAPVTSAPGLDIRDWRNTTRPTLNGQVLALHPYEWSRAVAIPSDQQSLVLGGEWSLRRYDRQGKQLWNVAVPGTVWGVNVSGDGRVVVAALADGTIRWYRLVDGKELLALFPHADRRRWVLWSPSGYYDASPGAEDLIGWHVNRGKDSAADFYPASRFRGTFYRPDVVAKLLGTLDEAAALRLANEDAGRKTQTVDVAKALPPVVEIVSPPDGTAVSVLEVRLRFRVRTAADAPITAVRTRVNGQAVSPADTHVITAAPTPDGVREITVPVPPRDSEIMLFAANRHGISVPGVLRLLWRGVPATSAPVPGGDFAVKPTLYLLAVGVSQYQDSALKLQYPAKDARDFAQTMLAQKGGLYQEVEVKLLTDAQATRDEVVDGLDWLQRQVTAKDLGMLFFAGHGVNDPNGIFYLLPANADTDKLKRTGVPYSEIRNTLASLAGKALFLFDACHAGNAIGGRRAAPPDITAVLNDLASAENGVVVLASSTGRQYSLESAEWNNGAFTKALVEGVNGKADRQKTGRITHKALDWYLAERVKELTQGKQTPVNISPPGVPDFPVALTPAALAR